MFGGLTFMIGGNMCCGVTHWFNRHDHLSFSECLTNCRRKALSKTSYRGTTRDDSTSVWIPLSVLDDLQKDNHTRFT